MQIETILRKFKKELFDEVQSKIQAMNSSRGFFTGVCMFYACVEYSIYFGY